MYVCTCTRKNPEFFPINGVDAKVPRYFTVLTSDSPKSISGSRPELAPLYPEPQLTGAALAEPACHPTIKHLVARPILPKLGNFTNLTRPPHFRKFISLDHF